MKVVDKGRDKVQKICDAIKKETLEPAHEEAGMIVAEARKEAENLVKKAKKEAEKELEKARKKIAEEKGVFLSSLSMAAKQSVAALRDEIESKLFSSEVKAAVDAACKKGDMVARFIEALVAAVEKEGLGGSYLATIGKSVSEKEVAAGLAKEVLAKLGKKPLTVGEMFGGAKLQVKEKQMTLDMSDETLQEMLATYAREDFRKFIFSNEE